MNIYELQKWQLPAKYRRQLKKNLPVVAIVGTILLVIISIIVLYEMQLSGNKQIQELNKGLQRLNNSVGEQQKQQLKDQQLLNEQLKKLQAAKEAKALALAQAARTRPARQYTTGVSCETFRPLFAAYAWNVDTALKVCNAESGGNVYAANWTDNHKVCMGSFGLMQVSCHSGQVYNPQQNIQIAYQKYLNGGWYQPWKNTCLKIGCPS